MLHKAPDFTLQTRCITQSPTGYIWSTQIGSLKTVHKGLGRVSWNRQGRGNTPWPAARKAAASARDPNKQEGGEAPRGSKGYF